MTSVKSNIIVYERELNSMARNSRNNRRNNAVNQQPVTNTNVVPVNTQSSAGPVYSLREKLKDSFISFLPSLILAICTAILGAYVSAQVFKAQISSDVNHITGTLSGIETTLASNTSLLNELNVRTSVLETQVEYLEKNLEYSRPLALKPREEMISSMDVTYVSASGIYCLAEPQWKAYEVIATSIDDAKEYTAEELVEQKVLFSYELNNQDVLFYGQFNENNLWDGECLINIYEKDGNLALIMQATYKNGKLLDYKQALPHITNRSIETWIISDRICEGNSNKGESWSYNYTTSYARTFDIEDVAVLDLLDIETFRKIVGNTLEGYYYGDTSDGKYNDHTGDAYIVKYDKDGTVRTLYKGCFKNGKFEDSTGNAWSIAYSEKLNSYFYNTGEFKNNSAIKKSTDSITYEEIEDIVSKYDSLSGLQLKWKYYDL